mmetsp:Transcript_30070/g.80452  ORF Transcript_30070/g.80452 Transcript_30070/m.80452 type:complete len:357 (-) Transcript_30070:333-1403(-)
MGAGHRSTRHVTIRAVFEGVGRVNVHTRSSDVDPVTVVRERRSNARVVSRRHRNDGFVCARVPVAVVSVVTRGEHDVHPRVNGVVDSFLDGRREHVGGHVTPRVGRDVGAVVGTVHQSILEAIRVLFSEDGVDHQACARHAILAASHTGHTHTVIGVSRHGAGAMGTVGAVAKERVRVVGVVVSVAVIDVSVVIAVDAVVVAVVVHPLVDLQIRVILIDARVNDLHDDLRRPAAHLPRLGDVHGVVVRLRRKQWIVDVEGSGLRRGLALRLHSRAHARLDRLEVCSHVAMVQHALECIDRGMALDCTVLSRRNRKLVPTMKARRHVLRLILAGVTEHTACLRLGACDVRNGLCLQK